MVTKFTKGEQMRKTYRIKLQCTYFGVQYKPGDRIPLSDIEKRVFESQNKDCLGDVVLKQVRIGNNVLNLSPEKADQLVADEEKRASAKSEKIAVVTDEENDKVTGKNTPLTKKQQKAANKASKE